jgi:hypothetical protein
MPNQSEDGIFVTAQRINDITPTDPIPEPGTLALVGVALGVLAMRRYRKA